eukprot:6464543-Amphidinium_carterae.4
MSSRVEVGVVDWVVQEVVVEVEGCIRCGCTRAMVVWKCRSRDDKSGGGELVDEVPYLQCCAQMYRYRWCRWCGCGMDVVDVVVVEVDLVEDDVAG